MILEGVCYWLEVDVEVGLPTGVFVVVNKAMTNKPLEGFWILVKHIEEPVLYIF